jgi:hypothetical protein
MDLSLQQIIFLIGAVVVAPYAFVVIRFVWREIFG